MKSLYLKAWDAFIRYHPVGRDGPPVIWLAGLNFSSVANFLETVTHPKLAGYRHVMVDYLGTGHSDAPPEFGHRPMDHAAAVAALLDHEGITGAAVVGFSMGGTVAICLADTRPDLVGNLIVCEGNLQPGGGVATKGFARQDEGAFAARGFPEILAEMRAGAAAGHAREAFLLGAWANSDPVGIHRSSVALVNLDPDLERRYFALGMRKTFIFGEASLSATAGQPTPDTPLPDQLRAQGIAVGIVPGAGHSMMVDNPDGFVDQIAAALAPG